MAAARRVAAVCLWVVMVSGAPGATAQAAEVIDRVLAVAGGDVITLSDIRAARELGRVNADAADDPIRVVLGQLVDRALVLAEVDRFAPPEPRPAAIDDALDAVIARFPSVAAFDAALARLGIDRSSVRDLLREDLRIRAYLDQRFTADTPAQQRTIVDAWIAGLRRRAEIVNLYEQDLTAPGRDTGAPGRD